jgi:hypothetical protein
MAIKWNKSGLTLLIFIQKIIKRWHDTILVNYLYLLLKKKSCLHYLFLNWIQYIHTCSFMWSLRLLWTFLLLQDNWNMHSTYRIWSDHTYITGHLTFCVVYLYISCDFFNLTLSYFLLIARNIYIIGAVVVVFVW